MSNFRNLMRFDAKSPKSQADELRRWSRQFNRSQSKFQTKLAEQTIASPEQGISCDKSVDKCDIVTVAPPDEQAVTVSSTCHDSPEPEIKYNTVGKCVVAAVVPYDGPANSTSSTCPNRSRDSAKSELIGCDQHQDAPEILTGCEQHQDTSEVMEIRTESDDESVKNEILALIIM